MSLSAWKPARKGAAPVVDEPFRTLGEDSADGSASERLPDSWREALVLWMQWNTAYEEVTENLYRHGQDHRRLEDLVDKADQIRRRAVRLSRELLN